MADNFTFTEGAGAIGAADDIAGVYYPFVKLVDGTGDSTTSVAVDVGVKANALRVAPANNITDGTYIGDIKFGEAEPNSAAIAASLAIIDDWDDGNYCNVNLNIAGTDVSANSGVLDAQTLRVTIATDDECNNLLGTIDADTSNMATSLGNLDNAVDGNFLNVNLNMAGTDAAAGEGVIDAQTQRVTLATDDDGVAHLATIAGDTTNIETAVQIIDDWDSTHGSAVSTDGPQVMAAYDSTKPTAVTDGQAVRVSADSYGRLLAGVEPQRFQAVYNSADASGEGEVVHASAASTVIVVQSYVISVDAEMWVELQDEDSSEVTGKFWLKAGGGVAVTLPDKAPIVLGADKDLEVITEGAGNISVSVTGYTIPG